MDNNNVSNLKTKLDIMSECGILLTKFQIVNKQCTFTHILITNLNG
jgi:hypothetical protein